MLESVVVVEVGVEVEAGAPQALGESVVGAEEHHETAVPRFLSSFRPLLLSLPFPPLSRSFSFSFLFRAFGDFVLC
jgi:hypothetical protein